jgi:ABC-type transport system substrate-binding protein
VDQAKQTTDPEEQAELFNEAETILLDDVGVIPIVWYRGDYVFNEEEIGGFTQTNFGLIFWEQVFRKS